MKQPLQLGTIAVMQLATGLALQFIVLVVVGAGRETDAFIAAQSVPLVLFAIVAVSLQSVWQPRLVRVASDIVALADAQRSAQAQVLIVLGGISVLAAATCAWWLQGLFPTFTGEQQSTAVYLTRVQLVAGVLAGHGLMYTVALRARDRFVQADLLSLVWSLISLCLAFVLVPVYGVAAAAWLNLLRAAATTVTLYAVSGRALPSLRLAPENRLVWQRLRPLLAGSALYKMSPLVDRYWGSQSGPGGLTTYNLALLAVGAAATILERALTGPFSVQAAVLVQSNDLRTLRRLYRRALFQITAVTVAALAFIFAMHPVWDAIFTRGIGLAPDLSSQLWFVSLLLVGYLHVAASGGVCVAIFYAHGNTRTPVVIGVMGFFLGLSFKSIGFMLAGLPGLAAGTSIMFFGNLLMFSVALHRNNCFSAADR